jgi:xanthine dehydrogenase small subunit
MRTAQNLLHRFWLETRPEHPLPASAVNAFASL